MMDGKQEIQIFGQRCSGTTFLEKLLKANFHNLQFVNDYGFKHLWNAKLAKDIEEEDKIKIIIITRDPYDWIRSVRREPHHCAQLLGLSLEKFLTEPWNAHRSADWNNYKRSIRMSTIRKDNWIESFADVLECRNAKMKLFASLLDNYKNVHLIHYEELRDNTQTALLNLQIFLEADLKQEFHQITEYKNSDTQYKRKKYIRFPPKVLSYFNARINWDVENKIGYQLRDHVGGARIDLFRLKFLIKQWYYENVRT